MTLINSNIKYTSNEYIERTSVVLIAAASKRLAEARIIIKQHRAALGRTKCRKHTQSRRQHRQQGTALISVPVPGDNGTWNADGAGLRPGSHQRGTGLRGALVAAAEGQEACRAESSLTPR